MRNLESEWVTQDQQETSSVTCTNLPRLYAPVRNSTATEEDQEQLLGLEEPLIVDESLISMSHQVLISCINECTEEDSEDVYEQRQNFWTMKDDECILTESSQPNLMFRTSQEARSSDPYSQKNLLLKQCLLKQFASKDSRAAFISVAESSQQLEFLSPTQSDEVESDDASSCCNAGSQTPEGHVSKV